MPNEQQLWEALQKSSPFTSFQEVDVTFPTTANADQVVTHTLVTSDPENVRVVVVRQDVAGSVYRDETASRRLWGKGYIVLRASVASMVAKVLLGIPR